MESFSKAGVGGIIEKNINGIDYLYTNYILIMLKLWTSCNMVLY
jgi:hypothetical protein